MSQNRFRIIFTMLLAALLLVLPPHGVAVADGGSREYQLKAAFIYNFAQFVEWPAEAFSAGDAPLVIGIVGHNPFGGVLEQAVAGKKAGGRNIIVRYFHSARAMERCHIVFVGSSERDAMPQIVDRCAKEHTLTVGDFDEFTGASGMIRFLTQDNRLRFEINLDAMNRGGLRISAKLLKLAQIYGR